MKKASLILLFTFVITCLACNRPSIHILDYDDWYKKNHQITTKEIGEYTFNVTLFPSEILAIREMENLSTAFSINEFEKAHNQYKDMQYYFFTIDINEENKQEQIDFFNVPEINQYFSSYAQNDTKLVECSTGDTLPCIVYHLEQNPFAQKKKTMLIGFKQSATSSDKILVFDDKVLNVSCVNIRLNEDVFKQLPEIIYQ